jgi:uncharacterized protein
VRRRIAPEVVVSVEVTPRGNSCNIQCSYCYQTPMRDADPTLPAFDLDAMKRGIEAARPSTVEEVEARDGRGQAGFSIFGGEALLTPIATLEALWKWGLARYGQNGLQTNGTLITDEHIALFRRYKVSVGISVDGPGALNDARWAGSLERTREMTARSLRAIAELCAAGLTPSLIVTLSRANAAPDRLPELVEWFASLRQAGITSINLHLLEVDHALVGEQLALPDADLIAALRTLVAAQDVLGLRFEPFAQMVALLLGDDRDANCTWHACDPYTTAAVQGVDGQGQQTNCGRTNKEGVSFRKASTPGYVRQLVLYQTPQADGGCEGCRFFLMCKGQCPGEGLGGDWRNRTDKCAVWTALFEDFERQLVAAGRVPLSLSPARLTIEQRAMEAWSAGRNPSLTEVMGGPAVARPSGSTPHGDVPHGDWHGDHTDHARAAKGTRIEG